MNDVSRKMAKGAAWMVAARLVDRVIGLTSTVILARLLVPADFGLVMLATVLIGALQLLTAFGFDLALIQNPRAERRHYDTVWTINILFACTLALALLFLADPAADFYDEPRLSAVMQILALGTLVEGFLNVGVVNYRKELQFEKEFRFLFTKKLAAVAVTITLAYLWRDYWALVVGTITGTVVAVWLSYRWQPYRPRLSLEARTELFSFSGWMFINNILGFLHHRAAAFVVAKGAGSVGLGHYGVALEIANLPSSELVAPVNRAVFPGYAKMSSDIVFLRQGFLNVISVVALLAIPAAVGLACVAEPAVAILLGPKWAPAVPLIQILAINGILAAIWSCSAHVYLAMGKPRLVAMVLAIHLAVALPLITWATFNWNIVGVAWMVLCASVLLAPVNLILLSAALQLTGLDLVKVLWRPVCSAAVMAGLVVLAEPHVAPSTEIAGRIIGLLVLVVYGAVVYATTVGSLWLVSARPTGAESFLLDRVRSVVANVARARST